MNFKEVRVFLGVISFQVNAELYMFVVQSAPLFYLLKKKQQLITLVWICLEALSHNSTVAKLS